ncbi:hypothetical protein CXB49_06940 [Chromobacterium sp. ATCC 53434]|nr:hypothetical protein CXB49_06940 [Chromobacterium sp. ATCC 53434]
MDQTVSFPTAILFASGFDKQVSMLGSLFIGDMHQAIAGTNWFITIPGYGIGCGVDFHRFIRLAHHAGPKHIF